MAKRKTIGENPLDEVIPKGTINEEEVKKNPKKERLTFHLTKPLIERLKNAVYWTPGLTLAELGEQALREKIQEFEEVRGEPFPPRKNKLPTGRPMK